MNEIFKKFNVFDYFSHLVPGAIVVLALLHHFQCKDQASMSNLFGCLYDKLAEHNTIAFWTFFLVASHCIGLVNNVISDFVWYGFRNNARLIRKEKRFVHAENNCSFIIKLALVILTLSVLFSLLFITSDFAAWVTFILVALALVFLICFSVRKKICFSVCKKNSKDDLNSYYEDYELVKDKYPSNNISNLEAQIAFLRNSIIPLVLLSLICIVKSNPNILLIVSPFIAFVAFFLHQQKLYFHVYELCHIIDLKGVKLKLLVLVKVKAGGNKTNVCNSFSQILNNKNCTEMCSGDLDGKKVGVVSFTDISNASFDTLKEKIEIYKDAKALVVTYQEEKVDLYKQIKEYAEKNSFELKEAASFEEIAPKIREFFNK